MLDEEVDTTALVEEDATVHHATIKRKQRTPKRSAAIASPSPAGASATKLLKRRSPAAVSKKAASSGPLSPALKQLQDHLGSGPNAKAAGGSAIKRTRRS